VKGIISEERFTQMSIGFEHEQLKLQEENAALQYEIDIFNEDNERVDKFVSLVRKYTRFEELTPIIINEFIDGIIIHESVWSEATEANRRLGTRSQQIDVHLKYIGSFEIPDNRTPEEIEADRIKEEKAEARRKKQRDYMRQKNAAKKAAKEKQEAVAQTAPATKVKSKKKVTA